VTLQLPEQDKLNYSREWLIDRLAVLMGGRIAEEITSGKITTGAGNDLEQATELARKMVCEWGMSDAMGPLTFGKREEQIFLGREISKTQDYSEETAVRIDQETKRFVVENYVRAKEILVDNKPLLLKIADELIKREVLDADQVKRLAQGLELEDLPPAAAAPAASTGEPRRESPERPPMVPGLGKAVTQE
jgi:cell division protease FtsH